MPPKSPQSLFSQPEPAIAKSNADGSLLALLLAAFYGLFTFVSSTQTILWPGVLLWQAMLILPLLWLLWQIAYKPLSQFRLGHGFDWLAGATIAALVLSTATAAFPQQALWYSIGVLGSLAALYALVGWLTPTRARLLLRGQGYLALLFIIGGLGLWWLNIYRPEVARLAELQALGVTQSFNFDALGLRNWYPLGHQNYVGGYLLLVLPLLAGLAWTTKSWQRWLWAGGVLLVLVDLYTTQSRGAILGLLWLIVAGAIGAIFLVPQTKRWAGAIALISLVLVGLFVWVNPRFRALLSAVSRGDFVGGGQVAYRLINNVIGWRMGQAAPLTGLGPGSVPLVYQAYRPFWAGREAELHHQLHSTPAQLWGELGLWGIMLPLGAAVLLVIALRRQRERSPSAEHLPAALRWSLIAGLFSYSIAALTDFQLDVVAIAGVLVLYAAILLHDLRSPTATTALTTNQAFDAPRRRHFLALVGVGLLGALVVWLIPIHRAWATSAWGFAALAKDDIPGFVTALEQAHNLAPWEAYYPLQLGWVLGDLSYRANDPALGDQLRADAITWFEQGNDAAPYYEFGHSNLGWLAVRNDPSRAIAQFAQSAALIPAKMGVFAGLGYSLFLANQPDLATTAIALEILRNPIFIPNRALNGGQLSELTPAIANRIETLAAEMLATATDPTATNLLHQVRGTWRWWQNDLAGATADWQVAAEPISLAVLAATRNEPINFSTLPDGPGKFALQAWAEPENRRQWLETAWLAYTEQIPQFAALTPPAEQIEQLAIAMDESDTFMQWLKANALYIELRNERLGFGVLLRHDDGPNPSDFYVRLENLAMTRFFSALLPSFRYVPTLDRLLQPYRDDLLTQLVPAPSSE